MQLNEERAVVERKRREREEQHLYLSVGIVTEENFKAYQGFDLINWEADPNSPSSPKTHRILRTMTVSEFAKSLAEDEGFPPGHVRLWVMVNRQNKTVRPDQPLTDPNMTIDEAYSKHGSRDKNFRLWLETAYEVKDGKPIWPDMQPQTSNNIPALVFLKHFDTENQTLLGVGHVYARKQSKVADMVPLIQKLMGSSPSSTSSQSSGRTLPSSGSLHSSQSTSPALTLYEVSSQTDMTIECISLISIRKSNTR